MVLTLQGLIEVEVDEAATNGKSGEIKEAQKQRKSNIVARDSSAITEDMNDVQQGPQISRLEVEDPTIISDVVDNEPSMFNRALENVEQKTVAYREVNPWVVRDPDRDQSVCSMQRMVKAL